MSYPIDWKVTRALTLSLSHGGFGILALVVIVLIHVHVTGSWFMVLRSLLFRRLGQARRRLSCIHRWERRGMMSGLGWMIAVVDTSGVRCSLRAVPGEWTLHLRRRNAVWRSRAAAVWLF